MSVGGCQLLYLPISPRRVAREEFPVVLVRADRPEKRAIMSTIPPVNSELPATVEPEPMADSAPPTPTDAATAENPRSATTRRKFSRTLTALLIVIGLALAGWASFGVTIAVSTEAAAEQAASLDTAIAKISTLDDANEELSNDLDAMTTSRDSYKDDSERVLTREMALTGREDAVKKREDAVTLTEKHVAATTLRDGMTYTVGQTMEPGTYQATPTGGTCYWGIYTSGSNYSDIVDNDLGSMGVIQVTVSAGQDFKSTRCGDWTKVG